VDVGVGVPWLLRYDPESELGNIPTHVLNTPVRPAWNDGAFAPVTWFASLFVPPKLLRFAPEPLTVPEFGNATDPTASSSFHRRYGLSST